jgi:hypothetical protein
LPAGCSRSVAITLPKQLWQPRDVDGDPPRLVFRQHLGQQCFGFSGGEFLHATLQRQFLPGVITGDGMPVEHEVGNSDLVGGGGILLSFIATTVPLILRTSSSSLVSESRLGKRNSEASPASQSHADLDAECAMQEYQARS